MTDHDDVYTHGHHASVLASHRWRTVANSASYLVPEIAPNARILDVGCGPGNISIDLARLVPHGSVLGIDRSTEVVQAALTDAASTGVTNVSFDTGDVYALAFPDDSFDVVHAHQVLQHLSDPVAALREMRRVCSPGGVVAARDSDYQAMTWHPADPALDEWLDTYRLLARSNGGEPDAGRRLLSWAQSAGLDSVTASASVWCFAAPDDRAFWGEMWADRVQHSAFATQSVERGLADADRLAAIADGWRHWVAAPDGWFAVLHGEIIARA